MKKKLLDLLRRYTKGHATDEEQQFLINFYNLFDSEPDGIETLNPEKEAELKTEIKAAVWDNINKEMRVERNVVQFTRGYAAITAAILIVVMSITGFFYLRNTDTKKQLTLSLVHKPKQNIFLVLPDGSKVILSPGSILNYASSFEGLKKREVYLEGEAFFDIKHNKLKPFIVHTGILETTVLGTAFNVKALKGEKTITITVTRGRVKVSEQNNALGIIVPNEQIVYNKEKYAATQNTINAKIYTDWTEHNLSLENVTVQDAAEVLEKRFSVKILFADENVKSKHFTCTFDKSETLENELKSICEFNEALYSYDKGKSTITISSKYSTN